MSDLLGDWSFNIGASLEFGHGRKGTTECPHAWLPFFRCWLPWPLSPAERPSFVLRTRAAGRPGFLVAKARTWWVVLAAGCVFLSSVFPSTSCSIPLVGSGARGSFSSGLGSGVVMTAILGLVCSYLWFAPRAARMAAFLTLGAVIVWVGSLTAIQKGAFERSFWERHRAAMMNILRAAPRVKKDTVIVLVNVPRKDDPFGDALWLDMALRLVSPGHSSGGDLFPTTRRHARPATILEADDKGWKWNRTGDEPLVRATTIAHTVIVDYKTAGQFRLVEDDAWRFSVARPVTSKSTIRPLS